MDAKERKIFGEQIKCLLEIVNGKRVPPFLLTAEELNSFAKRIQDAIKQARNEALEEAAMVADDCAGHYSPECECMNIAKAIRALKEK